MRSMTKALGNIRRKQEEVERRQQLALHRKEDENIERDVNRTRSSRSKISKPGKPVKVNLSNFKLKTVLGRGGYGKVKNS